MPRLFNLPIRQNEPVEDIQCMAETIDLAMGEGFAAQNPIVLAAMMICVAHNSSAYDIGVSLSAIAAKLEQPR
jgi:hypothetical protein